MAVNQLHELPAGYRIDRYEIVRVLGAGSFGITYLAFDHTLDAAVALKEYFPAGVAGRNGEREVAPTSSDHRDLFVWGLDRFLAEGRVLQRCRHRNVVRAHSCLEAHGTAYIVLDYVEGESLSETLKASGRLPAAQWRPWLDGLLDGLAHVHEQGYLHRDIKPGNIVVRAEDGVPVLIDFGAARAAARERTHTRIMTPEYAPIEQHAGQPQGPAADIYALAAVTCRVLTGDPPPSAPDRMLEDRYEPLAGRVRGAAEAWLSAIDWGLALRPEDRPQTVATWREALDRAGAVVAVGEGPAAGKPLPQPAQAAHADPVLRPGTSLWKLALSASAALLALSSLAVLLTTGTVRSRADGVGCRDQRRRGRNAGGTRRL